MRQVFEHSEIRVTGIAFANHKRLTIRHKNNHWTRWEVREEKRWFGPHPSSVNQQETQQENLSSPLWWTLDSAADHPTTASRIVWCQSHTNMVKPDLRGWLSGVEIHRILIVPLGNKSIQSNPTSRSCNNSYKMNTNKLFKHRPNHKVQLLS